MIRSTASCSVDGCDSTAKARKLCAMHYRRLRVNGDPLVTQPKGQKKKGKLTPCLQCGKEWWRYPSDRGGKYCSIQCRSKWQRAQRVNDVDGTARCSKCREWKPKDQFVRGRYGVPHSHCKPCNSQWFHERNGTPPERRASYRPAYKLTPDEKRASVRLSSQLQKQARRAAGPAPRRADIEAIWNAQDGRCVYCGTALGKSFHIDHKNPISKGGTNDVKNLQLLCAPCNLQKATMTHEQYLVSKKNRRRVTAQMAAAPLPAGHPDRWAGATPLAPRTKSA